MKKTITKYLNQPRFLRHLMNWYGPYRGAGVKIRHLADDFSSATVEMPLRWYNRNYVGVHFGGSLYSMVDPFHMLLIMNQLGSNYVVWDKQATIEFISPGTGTVTAHFEIGKEVIQDILDNTKNNEKYLPVFTVEVLGEDGKLVARAKKTIHVRKKLGK
ncbi:MAG: acyl-coenzyme A thioesterase PaaI-like protein [Bermanella sp.]|jgi:acyl-coenzyme A thioesterase PaaI-like protein